MNGKYASPSDRPGGIDLDYRIGVFAGSGASPEGSRRASYQGPSFGRDHAAAHPYRGNNEGDEAQTEDA